MYTDFPPMVFIAGCQHYYALFTHIKLSAALEIRVSSLFYIGIYVPFTLFTRKIELSPLDITHTHILLIRASEV